MIIYNRYNKLINFDNISSITTKPTDEEYTRFDVQCKLVDGSVVSLGAPLSDAYAHKLIKDIAIAVVEEKPAFVFDRSEYV